MTALTQGKIAPDFSLPVLNGNKFSLREALSHGPVLAAFFKINCPTCQFALPFLERIYKSHGHKNVTLVGISQNDAKDTAAFIKQYGVTFPVLLDEDDDDAGAYPVSNAYGLTNVPTLFWIAPDGKIKDGGIEISSVGWSRQDVEEINRKAAKSNREAPVAVFQPSESVPEFRAG